MTDTQVKYVTEQLTSILNGKLTYSNIADAVLHGILTMRKFGDFNGKQKKELLMKCLEVMADDSIEPDLLALIANIVDTCVWFANSKVVMKLTTGCGCTKSGNPV